MSSNRAVNVEQVVAAVRRATDTNGMPALLHGPTFAGNEWGYVKECIDTAWVSSAGSYVTKFEQDLAAFTGARHVVAVVNGTAALHMALMLAGVARGDEVLVPSLTFVATANATAYCGAVPHFCDVEERTLGLNIRKLDAHLTDIGERKDGGVFNRRTGRRITAVVPMHTFGHPIDLDALIEVAGRWHIPVVEDAAESLGSYYRDRHTGTFGRLGILSFNGNKIITTGGGGAILTNDEALARRARHLSTTAKQQHPYEFVHDEVGYNYRMPNINAALGCAQLQQLPGFVERKRSLARRYLEAFEKVEGIRAFAEPEHGRSNYWLNTLILNEPNRETRDAILNALNDAKLQSRPVWQPMHHLPMYKDCPRMNLDATENLACRIINVPSSANLSA